MTLSQQRQLNSLVKAIKFNYGLDGKRKWKVTVKPKEEMKKYLEFIEYEVLRNEYYYPNSPKYKIDFIEFLTDIDSLIESNFIAPDLIAISRKVSEKAREKLTEAQKEIDPKSIDEFEKETFHR